MATLKYSTVSRIGNSSANQMKNSNTKNIETELESGHNIIIIAYIV
jgi:hypothetical protein